jgi:hypothetical protein
MRPDARRSPSRLRRCAALFAVAVAATAAAPAAGATAAAGTAVVVRPAVAATLLPVAQPPAGQSFSTTVSGVSSLGLVSGTTFVSGTGPDGSPIYTSIPQRWLPTGVARWTRQQLPLPAGTTTATTAGITELGEVGATATSAAGVEHAVRWSVSGRTSTALGGDGTEVNAVGPNGPWGVLTYDPEFGGIVATSELVARDGTRTSLSGPDVDLGYYRQVTSIASGHVATVAVGSGVGWGRQVRTVLWQDGRTLTLPAVGGPLIGRACFTSVLRDGSVAYSGAGGMGVHVGGVPGTNVTLDMNGGFGVVACDGPDTIARDGSSVVVGGQLTPPGETVQPAIWRDGTPTLIPLPGDAITGRVAALASGSRAVVLGNNAENEQQAYVWHDGTITPLTVPAGMAVSDIVAFTDLGLVVGNLVRAGVGGQARPVAWQLT